jgi:hypothetical protein
MKINVCVLKTQRIHIRLATHCKKDRVKKTILIHLIYFWLALRVYLNQVETIFGHTLMSYQFNRLDLGVKFKLTAIGHHLFVDKQCSITVLSRQKFFTPNNEGNLCAKSLEGLSELCRDWTTAKDNHALWLHF